MTATTKMTVQLRQPSLVRNMSHMFTGNVVYAACQWLMLAVLTKFMSPQSVGQFALGTAISAPIIVLSQLQLRAVQATDTTGGRPVGVYLAVRVVTSIVALGIIAVTCVVARYPPETVTIIWAVALAKTIETFSDVLFGFLQQRERMDLISASLCLKGVLSVVVFGAVLLFSHNLFLSLMCLSLAWAAVLFGYDFPRTERLLRSSGEPHRATMLAPGCSMIWPEWQWRSVLAIAWQAAPLGLSSFLYTLGPNIPRYVLEKSRGMSELGIFAALTYLIVAGNLVINALGTASVPRLSGYFASGQLRSFYKLLLRMILLCVGLGIAGEVIAILWAKPLLLLLYRKEYAAHYELLRWVAAAAGTSFVASMLGYGFVTTRQFAQQVPIHIVATTATFFACLALIPAYGSVGAAWSLLIGSGVCCVLTGFALARATIVRVRDLNQKTAVQRVTSLSAGRIVAGKTASTLR